MATPMYLDEIKKYCAKCSLTIQHIDEKVVIAMNTKTGHQQIFAVKPRDAAFKPEIQSAHQNKSLEVAVPPVEVAPLTQEEKKERIMNSFAAHQKEKQNEVFETMMDIELPQTSAEDAMVEEAVVFAKEVSVPNETIEEKLQAPTQKPKATPRSGTRPPTGAKTNQKTNTVKPTTAKNKK